MIRPAHTGDIEALHSIRMTVKENVLNNPSQVTLEDYKNFLTNAGKGWVYVVDGRPVGFAILDLEKMNVWALFVQPGMEGRGIGKQLHDTMLSWYFERYTGKIWLSTARDTRADRFYRRSGWKDTGLTADGEVRFEMVSDDWKNPGS